jgi:hypothetical protein
VVDDQLFSSIFGVFFLAGEALWCLDFEASITRDQKERDCGGRANEKEEMRSHLTSLI